ncbi:HNH endonuclease [Deinococcus marmoris]|uniref:HNH endonuclease n=1 Tax=Deinococcus marmoris TaxID=249408 RepID=UPI0009F871C9
MGRPLLPGEIVHHRDGDSTNNAPENLIVLPSQRYHAHIEFHQRRKNSGMPSLFPEMFQGIKLPPYGGLFDCLLSLPVHEPPLPFRRAARKPKPLFDAAPLFLRNEQPARLQQVLIVPESIPALLHRASHLAELLSQFQVQVVEGRQVRLIPLRDFSPQR